MLIRDFLTTLTNRRQSTCRRRLVGPHEVSEQLESRTLLAGNVLVSLSGSNAQITGDAGNNEIEVVVDNGSVVVRGLNGTTINSGTANFTLANASTSFPGSLTGSLGDGDDITTIGPGITFTGNVALYGEGGSDTLRALTGTYQGDLALAGRDGATAIVIDGATVSGNVSVRGLGATVASITGSTIHGRLDALTGPGDSADSIVIKGTTIDHATKIRTGRGDDNVVIQNSYLNGQLIMLTGAGNDVVYIDSSSIARFARIATQRGNDTLQVVNSSSFSRLLIYAGGPGKDSADIAGNTTTHGVIKASQKSKYFSPTLVASRITDPTTGAIAAANALLTAAVPSLTLSTSAATFSESAGPTAAVLTVTRTGSTTAAAVVTLTSSDTSRVTVPATVTIPAGSTSATVNLAAIDNTVIDGDVPVVVTATSTGFTNGTATVTVQDNDADTMALTAIASASDAVQSNGTIITRSTTAQITGVTTAGATLTIDSNGDGVFDDGTTTAGGDGSYTVDVTLTHTSTNKGENTVVVRAVSGENSADTTVKSHLAVGSVVHFTTNLGAWDIELFDTQADVTVENFLNYVTTGAYQNMFVHRTNSGSAQFVQGGGFEVSDSLITPVVANASIQNQFNAANSNVAGTLAMALSSAGINSGTSGWFINTSDNSAGFDPGQYTVFGRVIGNGLTVVSQISSLTRQNLNNLYGSTALDTVPLISFNATNTTITGQIATLASSAVLTGTGTLFTTELSVGESVAVNDRAYFVASIGSDTSLTLTTTVPFTSSGGTVKKNVVPTDAEFVVFSDIGKILDTL